MAKIIHFYTSLSTLGGVESILKHHAGLDGLYGIESIIVLGCERAESLPHLSVGNVRTLGIRGWHTLSHMRERFAKVLHDFEPDIVVYHNLWACRHMSDLDTGVLRIGMLHTDSGVSRNALKKCAGILDGLICVSPKIANFAKQYIDTQRISTINYPINPLDMIHPVRPPLAGREIVIGFCGRLVIEQKRVDRLEFICSFLKSKGISYTLELLGEGSEMSALKAGFGSKFPITFLGRKESTDYWNTLRSWDFILFCSDYEGTPISLLEALSQGVIPLYPRIQSGGDAYVSQVDPSLLFDPDDLSAPSEILGRMTASDTLHISNLRMRCSESVRKNSLGNYFSAFCNAIEQFHSMNSVKKIKTESLRPRFLHPIPMFAIRRFSPHAIY